MKNHLLIMAILFNGIAFSGQSRFSKVDWEITMKPGLSNEFRITMILTTQKGREIIINPGENELRWSAFTFESKDLQYFSMGTGRYKINRDLTGKDSITIIAVSEELDLYSRFVIPVIHCQGIRLDNRSLEFDSPEAQQWTMIMNDHSEFPLESKWFDTTLLRNESDPLLHFENSMITLRSNKPVLFSYVRFVHETTGKIIIDHDVGVTYPSLYTFDFSGINGRDGRDGINGSMSAESGGNGENGEDGKASLSVLLFLQKFPLADSSYLVEVIAVSGNRKKRVFISADNPHITVLATGGNGGNGGKGGVGANARQTDKQTTYDLQKGGNGGTGGFGGHGGDGGDIGIIAGEDLISAESWVIVKNEGGKNGAGGMKGAQGSGDRGDNGLIHALFSANGGTAGESGKAGYAGRAGSHLGVRLVTDDEFKSLLEKAGWF